MNEAYQGWYKYIRNDINNKAVEVEVKIKIVIGGWNIQ